MRASFSGIVRDAFIARGHNAWSCDLEPSERPGPHLQGDVRQWLGMAWDMLLAFPPCTYLSLSGVRWLYTNGRGNTPDPERWRLMHEGADFFRMLLNAPHIPKVCVENPQPHSHAGLPPHTQVIQPYQHGHGETKKTYLWLRGLPPLVPSNEVSGRHPRVHLESPGPNRSNNRSRTYQGIADAMAAQWG